MEMEPVLIWGSTKFRFKNSNDVKMCLSNTQRSIFYIQGLKLGN